MKITLYQLKRKSGYIPVNNIGYIRFYNFMKEDSKKKENKKFIEKMKLWEYKDTERK